MSTISTTVTVGVTLGTGTFTSPLTVTATGVVDPSTGNAIYGPNSNAWTVVNDGGVTAAGSGGIAIDLRAGGSVTNTATITGYDSGIVIAGLAGTVSNTGNIIATGTNVTIGDGVFLSAGGSVLNTTAASLIEGYNNGVEITGTTGTVSNSGTIEGTGTLLSNGVQLGSGGSVTNTGGLIEGYAAGVLITGTASGTVTNSGTIASTDTSGTGVFLSAGGSAGNTGRISGYSGIYIGHTAGFVTNSGVITGTGTGGFGIHLASGGSVDNSGTAGLILGYLDGVYITGSAGTVTNSATIIATGTPGAGNFDADGVALRNGGFVANSGTGILQGGNVGIYVGNDPGTVINSGTIISVTAFGYGVLFAAGGNVTNQTGGYIYGGVGIKGGVGTVVNYGLLNDPTYTGAYLQDGGYIRNAGSALIEGAPGILITGFAGTVTNFGTVIGTGIGTKGLGIDLAAGGTVVDAGTIAGSGGTAISFGGTGGNRLILEHGYKLTGGVYGTVGATNTLELAGSVGAALTVGYNGLELAHFRDALFGPDGNNTLKVTNTSGTLPVTISSFTLSSDIIDLTALANGTLQNNGSVNGLDQLVVSNGSQTVTLQFDASDNAKFSTLHGTFGTEIMPCFCSGTRVLTPAGEVAVETLAASDLVVTAAGSLAPIRWIGRRVVSRRFADPLRLLPIRIAAGALGENVPSRDLLLSPDHAVLIDNILVHAGALVNGRSITREQNAPATFTYYHIELADHALILAENTPAETFIDNLDRMAFDNWQEHQALDAAGNAPLVEMEYPRAKSHRQVPVAMRARLADRAATLQRMASVA